MLSEGLDILTDTVFCRLMLSASIRRNQAEKSAQIPLMPNIYRNASQVLAYLGEDPDRLAFSTSLFIEKINRIFNEQAELEHDDMSIYYRLGTDDGVTVTKTESWSPLWATSAILRMIISRSLESSTSGS